jgi:hypothetical protein
MTRLGGSAGNIQPFRKKPAMFAFYSNRVGCLGSLVVSIVGSVILILLIRSCSGP